MAFHLPPVDFGNATADRSSTAPAAVAAPAACPACRSRSVVTTARVPDENTYWRCDSCGEVWNAGRRRDAAVDRNRERYIWR